MVEYNQAEGVQALEKAKASGDKKAMREAIIYLLSPEAEQVVELARTRVTTKDGYDIVMRACAGMGGYGSLFLEAIKRAGYPYDTAEQVAELMGY